MKEMAFWCRFRQARPEYLLNRFRSRYVGNYGPSPVKCTTADPRIRVLEKPDCLIHNRPTVFCSNSRLFAAPVQAKPKQEEKGTQGPRLNNEITADFIRLVTEEAHVIVSRHEALQRAKKLNLDLVEVQANAKPPVCKLMDYNKEKYKQKMKEKEHKGKSELTLRNICKEVRFSGKTEQKDLQMKANTVKRLMEEGYRVKCVAMGTEDQNIYGLLSRLSALIEDFSFVESGPTMAKKQAYLIVRHIKFGPSKKGSSKNTSTVVVTDVEKAAKSPIISTSPIQSPLKLEEEINPSEFYIESKDGILSDEVDFPVSISNIQYDGANDDFEKIFNLSEDINRFGDNQTKTASEKTSTSSPSDDNSYTFQKSTASLRLESNVQMQQRKQQPDSEVFHSTGESNQVLVQAPLSENLELTRDKITKLEESPTLTRPSYGIFGSPKANAPVKQIGAAIETPLRSMGNPSTPAPSYGVFSAAKVDSPVKQVVASNEIPLSSSSNPLSGKQSSSSSTAPTYGIFSGSQTNANVKKGVVSSTVNSSSVVENFRRSSRNPSSGEESPNSPSPSYGIFSNPKANSPVKQGGK